MRSPRLVVLVTVAVLACAVETVAQVAGSTLEAISVAELREVATGWSAQKQILGKDVFNPAGDNIGTVADIIIAPNRSVSYTIVGVGGFLGMGTHNVAVPVRSFKLEAGRIVLPGATKDALKATPEFEYAK
jgi:sporulation protein YlmC with PRC-barrel domain